MKAALRAFLVGVSVALFVAQPVLASHNTHYRWRTNNVNGYQSWVVWRFDGSFPTNSTMRSYVSNGRSAWNNVGRQLWFSWSQSASSPAVWVRYNDLWWPVDSKLAVATQSLCYHQFVICSGDITFNRTINAPWILWYGQATLACNYIDIQSVAAHEFGHLVWLNHSDQGADTMWPDIPCGSLDKRSLTTHDKAGIESLYPDH